MKYTRHTSKLAAWLLLPLGAAPLTAATRTWDAGGATNDWSIAANWTSNIAPVAGDTLVFPTVINTFPVTLLEPADKVMNNNLAAGTDIAGLSFTGIGYSLSGNSFDLISGGITLTYTAEATTVISANVSVAGVGQSIDSGTGDGLLQLDGNLLLNGNSFTLTGSGNIEINGQIGNGAGQPLLTKTGTGRVILTGFNNFSGQVDVEAGTLDAIGFIGGAGSLNIRKGAILAGDNGGIDKDTLIQGTLSPGAPTDPFDRMIFSGALTFSTNANNDRLLRMNIISSTAGSTYDQVQSSGTVTLNSANLELSFGSPAPPVGTVFTLINKVSAGAISGTFSGIAEGSASVHDGQLLLFSYTGGDGNDFTATILNSTPVAAGQSVTTDEDTALPVTLTATDANPQTLTYALVGLPAHGTLTGTAPNITYTPDLNYSGPDNFTFRANDGTVNSATATVSVTVNAVNDAPAATGLNTAEGYSEDTIKNLSNIVTSDVDSTSVTATLTLSNPAAGSLTTGTSGSVTSTYTAATGVWTASGLTADVNSQLAAVQFIPALNFNANFTIATSVSDGVAPAVTGTKSMTGTAVNDAPTISAIADRTVNEDTATGAIPFTIGDVETAAGSLTVSVTLSNPTLTPPAGISFGGSGASRTLSVTPAANQSGTATITVTVSDGTSSVAESFVLTVNAVNDAPTISAIANRSTNEDTATSAIPFTVGDVETAAASLTVSATSSNTTVVPLANITLGGSGASRTVTIAPAANQTGTSTITLTVSDGTTTASTSFQLTVTAVNDTPVISAIPDVTTNEDTPVTTAAFTLSDVETSAGSLAISASSSNQTLLPNASVTINGSGGSRTLTLVPAANQSGTATVTVTVSDGAATATRTFLFAVNPVNDVPVAGNQNLSVNEDAALPVTLIAADVENSPLTYSIISPPSFGSLSGTAPNLTYTPGINANGVASFSFQVNDGTSDSVPGLINITVNPVNDPPAFTKGPDVTASINSSATSLPGWATDIGDGDPEIAQTLTFNVSNNNAALFSVQPAVSSTGTLSFTPAPGALGVATVTISLTDDATAGGPALTGSTQTFAIRVAQPISGTVTVGPGGDFTSLTSPGGLFDILNQRILDGDLTAHITGDLTETGAIALNSVAASPSGSLRHVRIHPTGAARSITGSVAGALIRFNAADRITLNGSLGGTGSDRSLSIQNTSDASNSAIVWQQNNGADGCTDNAFRNLILSGSAAGGETFAGLGAGGTVIGESAGTGHHRNTYRDNVFSGVRVGIYSSGTSSVLNQDTLITGNDMTAVSPRHLRRAGVLLLSENRPVVSSNTIASVSGASAADSCAISAGIKNLTTSADFAAAVTNAQITGNRIRGVAQLNTFSSAGIALVSSATGTSLVANNEVAGIEGNPVLSDICAGIAIFGNAGTTTRVLYNSISVSGSIVPNQGIGSAESHFGIAIGAGNPVLELRNNAIRNEAVNLGNPPKKSYAIGIAATSFASLTASNNVYFTPAGSGFAFARTGSLDRNAGTDHATLAAWQTLTGQDTASQFIDPLFTSLLDLTPQPASPLIGAGVPVAGVTTDINGSTRSTTAPTVGAFGGDGGSLTALEQWRQLHFGSPDNSGDGADDADFDHDGLQNLVEYAFGLDPVTAGSGPSALPQSALQGGDLVLTFSTPPGVTGVSYIGEQSTTLAEGSWTPLPNTGTATAHEYCTPATAPRTFLRVRVTAP